MNFEQLITYYARQGPVLLLESQSSDHSWSRKSYFAACPTAMIKARGDEIMVRRDGVETLSKGNPWEALKAFRKEQKGFLFGYLGYDLKNHLEVLGSGNPDPIKAPDLYFINPGLLLEFDQISGSCRVLKGSLPEEKVMTDHLEPIEFEVRDIRYQTNQKSYLENIREAQRRILEGDFYEINLSHQLKGYFSGSSLGLYQRMKEIGPVPFGAYLQGEDFTVCCQSPERFLRKEGTRVFSQPIKGTAKRSVRPEEDEFLKRQLIASSKERAENLMIVDLVRNDLSRIARPGSVQVPQLFGIESFGTVHQMVSTVTSETSVPDPIDILRACFPMGSMTGTPKISVMKTIEELEDYRRGLYSGAIGYIDPDGNFDFNVVIRTAIVKNNNLFYSIGGAITGDSIPGDEWAETLVKALALLDTIGAMKV